MSYILGSSRIWSDRGGRQPKFITLTKCYTEKRRIQGIIKTKWIEGTKAPSVHGVTEVVYQFN